MTDEPIMKTIKSANKLPSYNINPSKSLHYTGVETGPIPETGTLVPNMDRAAMMYCMLGGWYKSFGVEGDSLPMMLDNLFGKDTLDTILLGDGKGDVRMHPTI